MNLAVPTSLQPKTSNSKYTGIANPALYSNALLKTIGILNPTSNSSNLKTVSAPASSAKTVSASTPIESSSSQTLSQDIQSKRDLVAQEAAETANDITSNSWAQSAKYNSEEAQKNRDFQLYMSNTSYQRAVKDLEAAGLNPILAYMNGGASTASGSTASTGYYSGQQADYNHALAASLIQTAMNNDTNLRITQMNNNTSKDVARINQETGKYSADSSRESNKYSANASNKNSLTGTIWRLGENIYDTVTGILSSKSSSAKVAALKNMYN